MNFKDITDTFLTMTHKPRIIHRLAGRIRVHIPFLLNIPDALHPYKEIITQLFSKAPGVTSLTLSYHTGNALIYYDKKTINDSEILDFINAISHFVIVNRTVFEKLNPDDIPHIAKRLKSITEDSNPNIEMPTQENSAIYDLWKEIQTIAAKRNSA